MDFKALHQLIPYAKGGKEKVLRMKPYPNVTLAMPGRHAKETTPVGGDFVVMVTDTHLKWKEHQFKHTDIFQDVELKRAHDDADFFMRAYVDVITQNDPLGYSPGDDVVMPGIHFTTFLCAAQCLAVAEYRRYKQFEVRYGGRFLPFRFAAGIAEGLWSAADAADLQKKGRPGVEQLENTKGTPLLTKELMK